MPQSSTTRNNKIIVFLSIIFFTPLALFGQGEDTSDVRLKDITVTTFRNESVKKTSLNIYLLNVDSLRNQGNFNITDLMAKTPGVSMLSTGVAIAKPVIRGLSGNRVLVLISGLKFDNQQWQEEHGLGISDVGIGRVELIKGPMSVLFGTEAVGGIINLVEEDKPDKGKQQYDAGIKFNSNTLGGQVQLGYKVNQGKRWFRIRGSMENNADYSDGKGNRVLNSRFDGYTLKSTYGFERKNWTSNNNLFSSFNRFGFIFNDIYTFVTPDARWNRSLNVNPNHMVLLNMVSSENKIKLADKSMLNVNLGVQSNQRMENEGGGQISLNMQLLTAQYLVKWDKQISRRSNLIISNLSSAEDNTNYGSRKIVPDARMQESNLAAYWEFRATPKITLENGGGFGVKRIHTLYTPGVNSPEKEIHPFVKNSSYYNFFTGISVIPNSKWNGKFNIATGVRVPNLAELSSNGLHEGVFTYEIGDPKLKNERIFSGNLYLGHTGKTVEMYLSPFYNYFLGYVYLAPTSEQWFGFPVYRYKQQNATQYGVEYSIMCGIWQNLKAGLSLSGMVSKTADGNYTPYVPARKVSPQVTYGKTRSNGDRLSFYASMDVVMAQKQLAPTEIGSKNYQLLNAGISLNHKGKKYNSSLSLSGNNLLNTYYFDNLSRFKYFGLYNIGRNIAVTYRLSRTADYR